MPNLRLIFVLLSVVIMNKSVFDVNGSVCDLREGLVVGDDDEGLSEFVAKVEKEAMQFLFVLGVE